MLVQLFKINHTCRGMRLSFSMHDIRNPWTGNTNMINGFYEEPDNIVEHRYLDARSVVTHHRIQSKNDKL